MRNVLFKDSLITTFFLEDEEVPSLLRQDFNTLMIFLWVIFTSFEVLSWFFEGDFENDFDEECLDGGGCDLVFFEEGGGGDFKFCFEEDWGGDDFKFCFDEGGGGDFKFCFEEGGGDLEVGFGCFENDLFVGDFFDLEKDDVNGILKALFKIAGFLLFFGDFIV